MRNGHRSGAACWPGSSAEMGFTIGEQLLSLGTALLLGVLVGLFYDGLRVLRSRLPIPLLGGLLDLLFWAAVTVALFCHALVMEDGVVRIYMAAGVFGGAAGYFLLLSPPVYGQDASPRGTEKERFRTAFFRKGAFRGV